MYPSNPNGGGSAPGGVSSKEAEAARLTGPSSASSAMGSEGHQSSNPSAPLLPSSPYNPSAMPQNLEPPPYSSVVAQDAGLGDWKNRSSSFSGGMNNPRPYPGSPQFMNTSKSTSGLDANNPPYPAGPSPAAQAPYPVNSGYSPYSPGSVPEVQVNAPYPSGPGYAPPNQPPYPTTSMPMPRSVEPERKIGFTVPVTENPRTNLGQSNSTSPPVFHPAPIIANQPQQMQAGMIYPSQSVWQPTQRARLIVFLVVVAFMIITMVVFVSVGIRGHQSFTTLKKSEFF